MGPRKQGSELGSGVGGFVGCWYEVLEYSSIFEGHEGEEGLDWYQLEGQKP